VLNPLVDAARLVLLSAFIWKDNCGPVVDDEGETPFFLQDARAIIASKLEAIMLVLNVFIQLDFSL
jgi:hypothetical protein